MDGQKGWMIMSGKEIAKCLPCFTDDRISTIIYSKAPHFRIFRDITFISPFFADGCSFKKLFRVMVLLKAKKASDTTDD